MTRLFARAAATRHTGSLSSSSGAVGSRGRGSSLSAGVTIPFFLKLSCTVAEAVAKLADVRGLFPEDLAAASQKHKHRDNS